MFAVAVLVPRPAAAQFQTISTDHFYIHFSSDASGTARRVAETAEEVFAPMAAAYDYYEDYAPIHIIVLDTSDRLGNGIGPKSTAGPATLFWCNLVFWCAPKRTKSGKCAQEPKGSQNRRIPGPERQKAPKIELRRPPPEKPPKRPRKDRPRTSKK